MEGRLKRFLVHGRIVVYAGAFLFRRQWRAPWPKQIRQWSAFKNLELSGGSRSPQRLLLSIVLSLCKINYLMTLQAELKSIMKHFAIKSAFRRFEPESYMPQSSHVLSFIHSSAGAYHCNSRGSYLPCFLESLQKLYREGGCELFTTVGCFSATEFPSPFLS